MTFVSALPVIWLVLILAAIFFEAMTEKLIAVWCAPAAAVAFVCALLGMQAHEQIAVFIVLTLSGITASRAVCAAVKRSKKHNNDNADIE